jgi:hypothetical protein
VTGEREDKERRRKLRKVYAIGGKRTKSQSKEITESNQIDAVDINEAPPAIPQYQGQAPSTAALSG